MSLENDPFDTQPAPLPSQPPLEPPLEPPPPPPTGEYVAVYGEPKPAAHHVPVAVWIGLVILALALVIAVVLLVALLAQGNRGASITPTPTVPSNEPAVVAMPSVVSGGTLVTLQGTNMRPNDLMIFYLRDPAKPTEPILQIGTTETLANGTFTWSFTYPNDARWTSLTSASVIVKSTATGGYLTVQLTVVPVGTTPVVVPTRPPPTAGPGPTAIVLTPTPLPVVIPTQTPVPVPTLTQTPNPNEWRGEYYNNPNLQGNPAMVRNDPSVNFDWGLGSPAPNIPVDYFSARWTRSFNFEAGMYRFSARSDDGVRVFLDSTLIIDEWHPATATVYTKDISVPAGPRVVRVEYYEGVGAASINFSFDRVTSFPDWKGDYFSNQYLSGSPAFTRNDVAVSFDWGAGSPAPGVPVDNFSVRWTRTVEFSPGSYRFRLHVNGGTNLFIDGNLIISQWNNNNNGTFEADYTLSAGPHNFEIDYFSLTGNAFVYFTYQPPTSASSGWAGNYFANDGWTGDPTMKRFDPNIDFNWGTGSPGTLLPVDHFSVRWTMGIDLPASGLYQMNVTVDDGVRIFVDNNVVMNEIRESAVVNYTTQVQLTQGHHEIRVEYVEYTGQAVMKFSMTPVTVFVTPTPTNTPTITPTPTTTSTPTATTTVATPAINSFSAQPPQVVAGTQPVTLTWSTSNVVSAIELQANGTTLQAGLPANGQYYDHPQTPGQLVYTLLIAASANNAQITATQTVQVTAPITTTVGFTSR